MIQREFIVANGNKKSTKFQVKLSLFKCENYERWVAQMKFIFKFQGVVEIVNDEVPALEENENDVQQAVHKERTKKDEKGLFLITSVWILTCSRR